MTLPTKGSPRPVIGRTESGWSSATNGEYTQIGGWVVWPWLALGGAGSGRISALLQTVLVAPARLRRRPGAPAELAARICAPLRPTSHGRTCLVGTPLPFSTSASPFAWPGGEVPRRQASWLRAWLQPRTVSAPGQAGSTASLDGVGGGHARGAGRIGGRLARRPEIQHGTPPGVPTRVPRRGHGPLPPCHQQGGQPSSRRCPGQFRGSQGEDARPLLGHRHGVLEIAGPAPVDGHHRPLVLQHPDLG